MGWAGGWVYGCIVEGHCPYSAVLVATEMVLKSRSLRLRFVATLRDPLTRVLSEFRHVCGPGDGAWDYREACPRLCKERVKGTDEHAADRCATPQAIETYVTDRANAQTPVRRSDARPYCWDWNCWRGCHDPGCTSLHANMGKWASLD